MKIATKDLEQFFRKVTTDHAIVEEAIQALKPWCEIADNGRYPLGLQDALSVALYAAGFDKIARYEPTHEIVVISADTGFAYANGSGFMKQDRKRLAIAPDIPSMETASRDFLFWLTKQTKLRPSLQKLFRGDSEFLRLIYGVADGIYATLKSTPCGPYAETADAMMQTTLFVWLDRLQQNDLTAWREMNRSFKIHALLPLGPLPPIPDSGSNEKRFWIIM